MLIAERTLQVSNGGVIQPLPISIYKPRELETDHWACEYEIGWPEGKRLFAGHGVDSVQALIITLQMIGSELYASSYHQNGQIIYDRLSGGYGFPVAQILRPKLTGEDKLNF